MAVYSDQAGISKSTEEGNERIFRKAILPRQLLFFLWLSYLFDSAPFSVFARHTFHPERRVFLSAIFGTPAFSNRLLCRPLLSDYAPESALSSEKGFRSQSVFLLSAGRKRLVLFSPFLFKRRILLFSKAASGNHPYTHPEPGNSDRIFRRLAFLSSPSCLFHTLCAGEQPLFPERMSGRPQLFRNPAPPG